MPAPIVTVSQLDAYIQGIFDAEEMLHNLRVEGEISGCSQKGENAYFTLKDNAAQIACCCFRVSKTAEPKNGDQVIVTGRPDFYPKNGRLSFIVDKIEPKGLGALYLELLQLKNRLEREGLFSEIGKIKLPPIVRNLCVVTSLEGAVIKDILSTIKKTTDAMRVTVIDVRVQGIGAAESIVNALFEADQMGFDAVILARGGGSFEDLMPFNTEEAARAVAAMRTPIVSAVGHETDFSLTDFTADYRALTPTAAAELVTEGFRQYEILKNRLVSSLDMILKRAQDTADYFRERMDDLIDRVFERKENELRLTNAKLQAMSPEAILKSGFIAAEAEGKRIKNLDDVAIGSRLTLVFPDGTALATVEKKEKYQ